jgi:hypothetical protein
MKLKFIMMFCSLTVIFFSCQKIKYGDFLIHRINLKSFDASTSSSTPSLYFKCDGPGVQDVSENLTYFNPNADLSFSTDFEGTRGSANYFFTLYERLSSGDKELATIAIDMGKFKGQDSFIIEAPDFVFQLGVNWEARW